MKSRAIDRFLKKNNGNSIDKSIEKPQDGSETHSYVIESLQSSTRSLTTDLSVKTEQLDNLQDINNKDIVTTKQEENVQNTIEEILNKIPQQTTLDKHITENKSTENKSTHTNNIIQYRSIDTPTTYNSTTTVLPQHHLQQLISKECTLLQKSSYSIDKIRNLCPTENSEIFHCFSFNIPKGYIPVYCADNNFGINIIDASSSLRCISESLPIEIPQEMLKDYETCSLPFKFTVSIYSITVVGNVSYIISIPIKAINGMFCDKVIMYTYNDTFNIDRFIKYDTRNVDLPLQNQLIESMSITAKPECLFTNNITVTLKIKFRSIDNCMENKPIKIYNNSLINTGLLDSCKLDLTLLTENGIKQIGEQGCDTLCDKSYDKQYDTPCKKEDACIQATVKLNSTQIKKCKDIDRIVKIVDKKIKNVLR